MPDSTECFRSPQRTGFQRLLNAHLALKGQILCDGPPSFAQGTLSQYYVKRRFAQMLPLVYCHRATPRTICIYRLASILDLPEHLQTVFRPNNMFFEVLPKQVSREP